MSLLEVHDLSVRYGAADAVQGVSLRVEEGEVVTIIGSNGAGKTTTLRAVTSMLLPSMHVSGSVRFDGRELVGMSAHRVARLGLVHVPEGRHVFPSATVEENLLLGAYRLKKRQRNGDRLVAAEKIYDMFPVLHDRRAQYAGFLSGGEQQQLAIGRALMAEPKLLVMDEPSLGLAPRLVSEMFATIHRLAEAGTTILLVEQMARAALRVADRAYALSGGRVVKEGIADDLMDDKDVKKAYLGA
ncbi:MAG TPA: ABC transporter ATP-binding protein [Acidimicrobiales bacterium]|nr:ABC transporter ATP-binding protein [Acidimicrobiales bacterium]